MKKWLSIHLDSHFLFISRISVSVSGTLFVVALLSYSSGVKNNLFKEFRDLPTAEFDIDITFHLRTTQTNEDKEIFARNEAKWIQGNSTKGKTKKKKTWDFESPFDLTVRVVRIKISDNGGKDDYCTICTSLDRFQFPARKIKELYRLRWGIESSFRELKYALGLIDFHACKEEFIRQEIFAHFLMYNYRKRIAMHVAIEQDEGRKWTYTVNHTTAVYICLDYFRYKGTDPPPLIPEQEIRKYILPVRDNRRDRRKITAKPAVCFLYRVA